MKNIIVYLFLLFGCSSLSLAAGGDFAALYKQVLVAQNTETYEQFVGALAKDRDAVNAVFKMLEDQLEVVKKLGKSERETRLQEFLRYYSKRHETYKASATGIEGELSYTWRELASGQFEAVELAKQLVDGFISYDAKVMAPIFNQVEKQILKAKKERIVICIGRDFTPVYLMLKARKSIPESQLVLLNVSRDIMEQVFDGDAKGLSSLLAQRGITPEEAEKRGLLFLDSSMKGKIPKAILTALTNKSAAQSSLKILSKSELIYIKSGDKGAKESIADLAEKALSNKETITNEAVKGILAKDKLTRIDEFQVKLPAATSWDEDHIHNLFEHLPKSLNSTTDIKKVDAQLVLYSQTPATPSEKINSLVGILSDVALLKLSSGAKVSGLADIGVAYEVLPKDNQKDNAEKLKRIYAELDKASRDGFQEMKDWVRTEVDEETQNEFSNYEVVSTRNKDFPFELQYKGVTIYRFTQYLSEGRNVKVYLTDKGTVVKITKEVENARKNILQGWSEKIVSRYGIPVAATYEVEPHGIYVEQEYIASDSLEYMYSFAPKLEIPADLRSEVLKLWRNAIKLAEKEDIWLDFKAANFHVGSHGIVFVDYTPRLNKGYFTYFKEVGPDKKPGNALSEEQFLEAFFLHDAKGKKAKKLPSKNACAASF